MKAILLAGGKGSRISRYIDDIPKSTLKLNEKPLIRYSVEMLLEKNIQPIVCLGYKDNMIIEALEGLDVKYYYNPFYDVTNSIASLWFAKEEIKGNEDLIIMNADVFISEDIIDKLIKDKRDAVMLCDKTKVNEGDYFFFVEKDCIVKYGKELNVRERNCEYVGLAKIRGEFKDCFRKRLINMINNQIHNLWWENVMYSFIDERDINVVDVDGLFWSEIDFIEDYSKIINYLETALTLNC